MDFASFVRLFLNVFIIAVGGLIVGLLVTWVASRFLPKWVGDSWSRFITSLLILLVAIWTIKLILDSTGLAGLTVVIVTAATGAFALGASYVASDLVAGVGLFSSRPYEVGEMVSLAGYEGRVIAISLYYTILENALGNKIFIRNSSITTNIIVNYSAIKGQLISVKVPLPVSQDVGIALDAIQNAIQDFCPELDNSKFAPTVLVETGGFGYITLEPRAYTTERLDFSSEKTRLFRISVDAIKKAGLTI
jgi:small conductance mechanosensitive channel